MARPYSSGLRERVVAAVKNGGKFRAAAARFGVVISTVVKWPQHCWEMGGVVLRGMGDRHLRTLDPQRDVIAEQPERHLPNTSELTKSLTEIAVESWRFGRLFQRLLTKLDAGDQDRYQNKFRWFQSKIEESLKNSGMRIVNMEGHPFDPGMAATPLNIEDFKSEDALVVDQMLEPIIMGPDGIIKDGTVTLRKIEP